MNRNVPRAARKEMPVSVETLENTLELGEALMKSPVPGTPAVVRRLALLVAGGAAIELEGKTSILV